MAIPRVFLSSTCYDLKYVRENLKYFIKTLGYDPVLSEEGSVYFDPSLHTDEACLYEVPNCQLFVLIIGGRFGTPYKNTEKSITNAEYAEAIRLKIPIFALVEQSVYAEYHVFLKNRANLEIDETKIVYPAVESTKIFDFIDQVRKNAVNNALVPFRDFSDMESYLRQQWAGMMFSFLAKQNEERRVGDTLSMLKQMSERIEMLSSQILKSVGTEHAKISVEFSELMLSYECIRDLAFMGLKPTPASVLINASFRSCAKSLGKELIIEEFEEDYTLAVNGSISRDRFEKGSMQYKHLREKMLQILKDHGVSAENFLKE